jgi:molybdopterin converting factor small subunit
VRVRVFGALVVFTPGRAERHELSLPPGTTAGEAVARLGVPDEEVWLLSVANRQVPPEYVLADGDELLVFPPVGGG